MMDEFQLAGLEGDDYTNARNACNQIAIAGLGWHPDFIIGMINGFGEFNLAVRSVDTKIKRNALKRLWHGQSIRRMRHQRRSVTKR